MERVSASTFVDYVMAIYSEAPTYATGGTGEDGTCDCIGLVMGALKRAGAMTFPLHGSNYFARWEMATLESTEDAALVPGMVVFKARTDAGELPERYKNGGRYYNGDLRDYYHAGVVVGVRPIQIVHCTDGGGRNGVVTDDRLHGWTHAGQVLNVEYGKQSEVVQMAARTALVASPDGNPVKLRPEPSTKLPYIAKIPSGSSLQVHEEAHGWAKVHWQGQTGYCMSQFLKPLAAAEPSPPPGDWETQVLSRLDRIIGLLRGEPDG